MTKLKRCSWSGAEPAMIQYHDTEWGVPLHDERKWFEFLQLEGAQAGLSWRTILLRREGYRAAFDNFDVAKIARYTPGRIEKLRGDARIIRNRLKIESTVSNARAFLKVQDELGSFDAYMWDFVDGRPIVNRPKKLHDIPATTPLAAAISKDLKKRGFRFVGPTIVYALMQATGLVNDHIVGCFRQKEVQ